MIVKNLLKMTINLNFKMMSYRVKGVKLHG